MHKQGEEPLIFFIKQKTSQTDAETVAPGNHHPAFCPYELDSKYSKCRM